MLLREYHYLGREEKSPCRYDNVGMAIKACGLELNNQMLQLK
jgi:hypothetical protein